MANHKFKPTLSRNVVAFQKKKKKGKLKEMSIYDFISVNLIRFLKSNKSFVVADKSSQVFYTNYNSLKDCDVVKKTPPCDSSC